MLLLLAVALIPSAASAATSTAEADSAYARKDYATAVELYRNTLQEKGSDAALLFNLGNAYFQEGDYGQAMLSYLRARRIDPSIPELNANISYLRSRVDDANKAEQRGKRLKVTADEPSFFQSVRTSVAVDVASDVWAVWGAVAFILFMAGAATYIFSRNVMARKVGFFGGGVCIVVCVVFLFFSFMGARASRSKGEGVITAFKTTLLTEPGKQPAEGKGNVLTKGSEVQILSEEADAEGNVTWYKVRLNTDYIGWVEAGSLEII